MNGQTTSRSRPTAIHPLRAAQALVGILVAAVGVAAYDWRAGLAIAGILLLVTSGIERARQ